jgi:hypothetical protein
MDEIRPTGGKSAPIRRGENPEVVFGAGLNLLSKVFDNDIADQSANDSDRKISGSENILNAESQAFSLTIHKTKLSHQEVGIE